MIHELCVKSDQSDSLKIPNENSVHAQKIKPGQRSQFLVVTKGSTASGDKNVFPLYLLYKFVV